MVREAFLSICLPCVCAALFGRSRRQSEYMPEEFFLTVGILYFWSINLIKNTFLHFLTWASLVAQLVKNLPTMRETWVRSLDWEDPLEKGKATLQYSGLENSMDSPWGCKESDTTDWVTFTFKRKLLVQGYKSHSPISSLSILNNILANYLILFFSVSSQYK